MVLEYLENNIKIDTGVLLKAVLQESAGKEISQIIRSLDPSDQEVTLETLTNDIKISLGLDPFQARRAAHVLIKNKYVVPVLSAEIQYTYDDYIRINRSKNPVNALVSDVSVTFGDMEDAFILTATDITTGDNEGIFQSGNFTAATTELNMSTFALGVSTLAGMIGDAVSGMKGDVRKNPLVLVITPLVESTAAGVLNTNSDKSILQAWDEQLKLRGGAGSGVLVAERLGCTIDFSNPKELVITNAVESSTGYAALVVKSPKVMSAWASTYEQRLRDFNKADGYYNKVVERWLHLVHNAEGIIGSAAVVLS